MPWIRVDTNLEMDRRFRRLSGVGRALLQFVWRLAKDKEGKIDADDWDVEYFVDMIGFENADAEVEEAMCDIVKYGFVEKFEGGRDLFIPNWDKFQNPKDRTNAERQRRYREKKQLKSNADVTGRNGVTNVTVTRNAVHDSTVQDSTRHDVTVRTSIADPVPEPAPKKKRALAKKEPSAGTIVWQRYAEAYSIRYGVEPIRNAKTNSICSQLVQRLGKDAPSVAAFFLGLNAQYYITRGHGIAILLSDAEKVHTEWLTGNRVTQTSAREADRMQSSGDAWARVIEKYGDK